MLAALEEPPPDELLERLMMIVVTIWNAHAMALPVWGEPEHLSSLRDTVYQQGSPAELAELFELLSRRREQRFANDPRVVGDHRISRTDGSFRLSCDGKLPRRSLPPR